MSALVDDDERGAKQHLDACTHAALGSLSTGINSAKSRVDIAVVLAAARERSFLPARASQQPPLGGSACASSHSFARTFVRGRSEAQSHASLHSMEGQELHRYHAKCMNHLRQTSTHAYSVLISPTRQPIFVLQRMHAALWS